MNIYFVDALPSRLTSILKEALPEPEHSIVVAKPETTVEEHKAHIRKANVLIHSASDLTMDLLSGAEDLKKIIKYQMRPGRADLAYLQSKGIAYVEIPCMAIYSVAEFTIMLMLIAAKEFVPAYEGMKDQPWLPDLQPELTTQTKYPFNWTNLKNMKTLAGQTLGIVGMGTIGKYVAHMAQAFGMSILYYDQFRLSEQEEEQRKVCFASFDDLLRASDFVTVHLKLTDKTESMFGSREFHLMKRSAFFINTSRGRVVDEEALCEALEKQVIAGAALDVFRYEPLPSDSLLRRLNNVILTPHIAGIPLDTCAEQEAAMILQQISSL